jgi:hypothetical protein
MEASVIARTRRQMGTWSAGGLSLKWFGRVSPTETHILIAVSARLDPSWSILVSPSTPAVDRCLDVFVRPEGTFGFEEFRRNSEDMGA